MAATPPPTITPAPTPAPQRGDRTTFSSRVDAFVTWLTAAVAQFNAVATNVYNNAVAAFNSATTASAAADGAIAASNVSAWVSGTTYAVGVVRYSLINFRSYRRRTAGAGTTDPSLDPTNWADLQAAVSNTLVVLTSQTWTPPLGVTRIEVEVGGGGASSGRSSVGSASPGAPAGGTAIKTLTVDSSTTYTLTVGAGGLAPALDGTPNNGGASSFAGPGITTVSATGGNATTGRGGVGSGGDLNIMGGVGAVAPPNNGTGQAGGASFRSGAAAAGTNGNPYGGGAASSNSGTLALVGGAGYIIIKY